MALDTRRGVTVLSAAGALAAVIAVAPASAQVTARAGSGIDQMTPMAALAASARALRGEANLTVSGSVTSQGHRITIDLRSAQHGAAIAGTLSSNNKALGFIGTLHVVKVSGSLYLHADRTFWGDAVGSGTGLTAAQRARLLTLLVSNWIKLSGTNASSLLQSLNTFAPSSIATSLTKHTGTLSKGAPVVVHGVSTLPIRSSDGSTVFLARTGPPLPVKAMGPSSGSSAAGGAVFVTYPKVLRITAPAGAKSIAQIESSFG